MNKNLHNKNMELTKQQKERNKKYNEYVESKSPKTKPLPSLLYSFIIGGFICSLGQAVYDLLSFLVPQLVFSLLLF